MAHPPRRSPLPLRATLAIGILLAAVLPLGCSDEQREEDEIGFVQLEGSRLIKVQTVGLAAFGPINPHTAAPSDAAAAYGTPSSVERQGERCRHRWPDLGLTVDFAAPFGGDPCGADASVDWMRVGGRAAAEEGWRTAEGIFPGMTVEKARRIYPDARRDQAGRLVLVEPLEEGGSRNAHPVLAVETAQGRVDALVFPIDAAG